MSPRNDDALDILIEDLALQLLSAEIAAEQAKILDQRLDDALAAAKARKAGKKGGQPLELQRALTGVAGRAGERVQEMRVLARTLEWNLRYYLARRAKGRAAGRGQAAARRAR